MSYILSIETATEVCSVALGHNGQCLIEKQLSTGLRHSSGLTTLIQDVLTASALSFSDLSAVCISDGPGSYTGLRVGASSAKALCYSLDIPLIAIPTLQSIAIQCRQLLKEKPTLNIVPTIDARRMEVYTCIYDHSLETVQPTHNLIYTAVAIENILDTLQGDIYICGHGAEKLNRLYIDIEQPKRLHILPFECNASYFCELAHRQYVKKQFVDVAYHTPYYYKSPNITTPKARL